MDDLDPVLHTHSVIEHAGALAKLGYGIEKTHADGRFEIAGVSRETVEAFSTRRTETEAMPARLPSAASAAQQDSLGHREGTRWSVATTTIARRLAYCPTNVT